MASHDATPQALDAVEAMGEEANVLVVTNEGKFFCNGADMSAKMDKEQAKLGVYSWKPFLPSAIFFASHITAFNCFLNHL